MRITNTKILVVAVMIFLFAGCTLKSMEGTEPQNESASAVNKENNYEKTGVWSPDGKWIAVTTTARTWTDTTVIDTELNVEHEIGVFKYISGHKVNYGYKIGTNKRPDPNVTFLEWCPDSKKLLLSYSFTDDSYVRQNGVAVFCLEKMAIDCVMKLGTQSEDTPEIDKPSSFDWLADGYGLKPVM